MKRIGASGLKWMTIFSVFFSSSLWAREIKKPSPTASPSPQAQKSPTKKKTREATKDTEGTVALDRFEADTVIKSQYTLDGKPLEVDPD
ncbi:MAG: hypothetical protein KGQ59_07245 [Bdellovibrionales bacterium]|nr:hypothetical protein [Bdellovibrionales bacterium]